MNKVINKGDILYYSRVNPKAGIYDLCELKIRTVTDTYFVGVDKKDKQAHIFGYNALNSIVFENRKDALNKLKYEENTNKNQQVSSEAYYEEY